MDESRKQFEAWVINKHQYDRHFFWKSDESDYVNTMINDMWEAWQASRAAVEVELTETFSPYDSGDEVMWIEEVEKAIRAAGIRVKG